MRPAGARPAFCLEVGPCGAQPSAETRCAQGLGEAERLGFVGEGEPRKKGRAQDCSRNRGTFKFGPAGERKPFRHWCEQLGLPRHTTMDRGV